MPLTPRPRAAAGVFSYTEGLMTPLTQTDGREIWFGRVGHRSNFESPFESEEFVLLLVTGDSALPNQYRELCDHIVRQPCRYVVCAGAECELWHDYLDESFLATDPNFNPPHERIMMTSWHTDEPLGGTVQFFLNSTGFDSFVPRRFLVLFIEMAPATEAQVIDALLSSPTVE